MDRDGIRPYEARDLEHVLDVWERASRVGHPFLTDSFLAAERERVRILYMPAAETWVFDRGGRPIAFLSLIGDEVGALFVDPSHHRCGVGAALMNFAKARGRPLELDVFAENTTARPFYERCGFVVVGGDVHAETGRALVRMRYEPGAR